MHIQYCVILMLYLAVMYTIQNELLSVTINERGAELDSIFHKKTGLEYLWNADPAFWAKKSPVLFPVVGTLRDNTYFYEGKIYHLSRHGFARESTFEVSYVSSEAISFSLSANPQTLENFPFDFTFNITYTVESSRLSVEYQVTNNGKVPLYFSVGGHPAFKVPLVPATEYTDYYLEFTHEEHAGRWPISKDGLIETQPTPLLDHTRQLPLQKHLFYSDALVFKHLKSEAISIRSSRTPHGLTLDCKGFPYLGIWAAKDADFVCIEPWYGIADPVNSNQKLDEKEGINKLEAGLQLKATWGLTPF